MYRWGAALAVLAGAANHLGHVLNKLEVNRDAGRGSAAPRGELEAIASDP